MKPTILLLSFALLTSGFTQEAQRKESLLTVVGTGVSQSDNDTAQVSLAIKIQSPSSAAAAEEISKKSQQLLAWLRKQNLSDLRTVHTSVEPRYSYEERTQKIVGYTATQVVTFKTDAKSAGELASASLNQGANEISSIQFIPGVKAKAEAQQQAIAAAIKDAKVKADAALAAAGLNQTRIYSIDVSSGEPPQYPMAAMSRDASAEASIATEAGQSEINASVTLTVEFSPK